MAAFWCRQRKKTENSITIQIYIWISLVFFLAGFVRGYSGFGFSAVVVAGLTLVTGPVIAVPTAIFLEVIASVFQARSVWRQIDWRRSAILLIGSVLGNPVGVYLLEVAPQQTLKAAIYVTLLAVAIVLRFVKPVRVELSATAWLAVAVAAGVVNGATAMSGLFIVAVMTITAIPPARMRATLIAYFFFSDVYAAGLLVWRGMVAEEVMHMILYSLPFVVVGILLGSRRFLNTNDEQFRAATLIFLSVLSIIGLSSLLFGAG